MVLFRILRGQILLKFHFFNFLFKLKKNVFLKMFIIIIFLFLNCFVVELY